ncbi:hypothetical protein JRQ81_017568 [Phrynocephalus forsythii]|uniref:Death domain-containing protein n=1 Tax=Phrynocephalus forsythii TaxID=171643 RepID=A0A9Q0XRM3_9SAUR|nr:hypothetical protein JRQ81_017568 [Phrynocephalus forsythii]
MVMEISAPVTDIFFLPPFMAQRALFKNCVRCGGKIPFSDGHSSCLYCLGETHSPSSCPHCKSLSSQALRNRRHRLNTYLLEKSLKPQMESESTSQAAAEPVEKPAKKSKSKKTDTEASVSKKPRRDKSPAHRESPSLSPNRRSLSPVSVCSSDSALVVATALGKPHHRSELASLFASASLPRPTSQMSMTMSHPSFPGYLGPGWQGTVPPLPPVPESSVHPEHVARKRSANRAEEPSSPVAAKKPHRDTDTATASNLSRSRPSPSVPSQAQPWGWLPGPSTWLSVPPIPPSWPPSQTSMDAVINLKSMQELGKQLGFEWPMVAYELGFSRAEISQFHRATTKKAQAQKMLESWYERSRNKLKKTKLLQDALERSGRKDLADKLQCLHWGHQKLSNRVELPSAFPFLITVYKTINNKEGLKKINQLDHKYT